ncbi:cation diffusion facilitator family transporter [Glycomyces sp. TRM65418]|uniref:cation diffusion facilitator family transporter n=1 Tax=Glycomyces sp. TRM65418 TaxID=2867006 RepID=UPI001CE6E980|nr:cation diffusion facilitator family transporter [Glycomyces sp. TRM65418]MCC3765572.1 cation diffusion facilitator family transporter [Glycomyces sp. TRM65418]QZD55174.1 cation diffusion facilitator family transporter [Glycomyces sp. TRM65418]
MGHDHSHATAVSLGSRHRGRLWLALGLAGAVMVAEAVAAWYTHSLALLSDAAHVAGDALGIAMALAAIIAVRRANGGPRRTYGMYRLEVLAALANTVLLFGVAGFVLVQAVRRLQEQPEVQSGPMLAVAVFGLAANVASLLLLRSAASESINVRGAYFEVLGDAVASIGVIAAAVVIAFTGWYAVDSLIAVGVGLFILPRAYRLGRDALRILLQHAPVGVDPQAVETSLGALDGVKEVHDLHLWTLTSGMEVATVHLALDGGADPGTVLGDAQRTLAERFGIAHATVQIEPGDPGQDCGTPHW